MEYESRRWFNLSSPLWKIPGTRGVYWTLWYLFNRHTRDGAHWWGFGVLQISTPKLGNRYLFAVMYSGVSVLYVGRIP